MKLISNPENDCQKVVYSRSIECRQSSYWCRLFSEYHTQNGYKDFHDLVCDLNHYN